MQVEHLHQEARQRLVALEALVDHFGRWAEDQKEMLASWVDAEGATRAQGLVEFQEFLSTWIGEMEWIQESLT